MSEITRRGMEYHEVVGPPADAFLEWVVRHDRQTSAIYWQSNVVSVVGRNGFQPQELLELVAERLRGLNAVVPSRETSLAITKIEEAILWLDERTRDRIARGVEGTHEK